MLTFTTSALTTFKSILIFMMIVLKWIFIDSILASHQDMRYIYLFSVHLSARIGYRNFFIVSIYLVAKLVRNRKKVVRKSNLEDK